MTKYKKYLVVVKDFLGQPSKQYIIARSKAEAMRKAGENMDAYSRAVRAVEPIRASQLIKMLQNAVKRYGDLQVNIDPKVHVSNYTLYGGKSGVILCCNAGEEYGFFRIATNPDEAASCVK